MKSSPNGNHASACQTVMYSKAATLFEQKRELMKRLNEINRTVRDLRQQNADAVSVARADVPFRNTPGIRCQDCNAK